MGLQRRQNHGIRCRGLQHRLASIGRRKTQQVLVICRYDQAPTTVVSMVVKWVMGRAKRKRQFDVR